MARKQSRSRRSSGIPRNRSPRDHRAVLQHHPPGPKPQGRGFRVQGLGKLRNSNISKQDPERINNGCNHVIQNPKIRTVGFDLPIKDRSANSRPRLKMTRWADVWKPQRNPAPEVHAQLTVRYGLIQTLSPQKKTKLTLQPSNSWAIPAHDLIT